VESRHGPLWANEQRIHFWSYLKYSTSHICYMKLIQIMTFREIIIPVYSENKLKLTYSLCGRNTEVFNIKPRGVYSKYDCRCLLKYWLSTLFTTTQNMAWEWIAFFFRVETATCCLFLAASCWIVGFHKTQTICRQSEQLLAYSSALVYRSMPQQRWFSFLWIFRYIHKKVRVKQSRYRPGVAQRVRES